MSSTNIQHLVTFGGIASIMMGKGNRRDRKPHPGRYLHNESIVQRIRGRSLNCSCCNNAQTGFVLVCCITFQHCPGGSWLVSWNDIGRGSHFSEINHDIHQHFHFTVLEPAFQWSSPYTKSYHEPWAICIFLKAQNPLKFRWQSGEFKESHSRHTVQHHLWTTNNAMKAEMISSKYTAAAKGRGQIWHVLTPSGH